MAREIERKVPPQGSVFRHSYKGRKYVMTVVKEHGEVRYSVSGRLFRSPSAAAVSITGMATNGWRFWGMDVAPGD